MSDLITQRIPIEEGQFAELRIPRTGLSQSDADRLCSIIQSDVIETACDGEGESSGRT